MNDRIRSILQTVDEFEKTEASVGLELRLSLAELILRHLSSKNWTQRQLAEKTRLKESYISRVLHSNSNCTLDTAGKLLFALDVRARLRGFAIDTAGDGATSGVLNYLGQEYTHGQTSFKTDVSTAGRPIVTQAG